MPLLVITGAKNYCLSLVSPELLLLPHASPRTVKKLDQKREKNFFLKKKKSPNSDASIYGSNNFYTILLLFINYQFDDINFCDMAIYRKMNNPHTTLTIDYHTLCLLYQMITNSCKNLKQFTIPLFTDVAACNKETQSF